MVDFEIVRPVLSEALRRSDPSKSGRSGFDVVLKFRMLVLQCLQSLHGLSLHQTSYLTRDRLRQFPTLIDAHERAIGGVLQLILYDNMKTVPNRRDFDDLEPDAHEVP